MGRAEGTLLIQRRLYFFIAAAALALLLFALALLSTRKDSLLGSDLKFVREAAYGKNAA